MEKEKADEGIVKSTGFSPYVNSEHGVSLTYPEDWKKIEGYMGTLVSFLCLDDAATGHTSLNLLVQDVPPGITLEGYANESLAHMQTMMSGVLLKVWDGPMFEQPGKRLQFVTDMGPFKMKVFQAFTVARDQAYILTFSAPEDTHDRYREQVETVIQSTKFVKAEPREKPVELLCLRYYENPTHLFRVRFPRTWTQTEPKREGGPVVQAKYTDKLAAGDSATYTLTADVTISTLPDASWGNEEYKDVALMRLGDLAGGEENIQLKETKLGGLPAIQARYSSPSEGTTNLHVFTVKEGKAYNIAFATSTPKTDARPYPIFARIMSSFTILPADYTPKGKVLALEHLVHKVSFEFPEEGWEAREGLVMTTLSFERDVNEEGIPRSNINLVVTDLTTAPIDVKTLDDFNAIVQEQLSMAVESLKFVHQKDVKMGGRDARELRYRGFLADQEFGFQQTFTILDNNAYIVSFSSKLSNFDSELELATPIISSFTFL